MSAQANIVVFDGAATPVSHTLEPIFATRNPDGSLHALWRENIGTLPMEAQVSVEARQRTLKSGVTETRVRYKVPVMESISGQNSSGYTAAPKVAYTDDFEQVGFAHPRSTTAGRRLVKQMATNVAGNVATSVTPISAGVFDEIVAQLKFVS